MNVLVVGQGIAGTTLAWELERRGIDFLIVDRPITETASRVAAGLVNPLAGRTLRPGWRQDECLSAADQFYRETEQKLGGSWWQKIPIFRELETEDQQEIWNERQTDEVSSPYAGPLFPWPEGWQGKGKAAYTRGSAVLHAEAFVNAAREYWTGQNRFREADVQPGDITGEAGQFTWQGQTFTRIVWCTGWETGSHPAMIPLKGQPSKGTIIDLKLPGLKWESGILHFGHWLVPINGIWRFGATYTWSWDDPGAAEAPAVQELMLDLISRYKGEYEIIRARAAVRPIIRRGHSVVGPVAGPIPELEGQYFFSGLGSKGVTTAPWTAAILADHLQNSTLLPDDLTPSALWR